MSRPRSGACDAADSTSRMTPTLLAWSAVGLVVVIVVALVVVKLAVGAGPSSGSAQAVLPASPQLVREVSSVPASVFDEVGVAIPSAFVGNPLRSPCPGQPPLTLDGRTPTVLFYGAEYCPFCAAERWALVVALARFGTWHGLDTTASGLLDGDYRTFSFRHAVLDSPYVHFVADRGVHEPAGPRHAHLRRYGVLQTPTPDQARVLDRYGARSFVPNDTRGSTSPSSTSATGCSSRGRPTSRRPRRPDPGRDRRSADRPHRSVDAVDRRDGQRDQRRHLRGHRWHADVGLLESGGGSPPPGCCSSA